MSSIESTPIAEVLGHELVGSGPARVVIMNDWLCDTSAWDGARVFLDRTRFTFAFADLRGYGRSRGLAGEFTLAEAASDVIALADALGWPQFAVVGHSMSALVAIHLGQHHAGRIERVVALTPPPPMGLGVNDDMLAASRALALADDRTRMELLTNWFGSRLPRAWAGYKASRWRACSDPVAAAAYVPMFARDGLPEPSVRLSVPVLAITGEQDDPSMRSEAVKRALGPICDELVVSPLAECGHYPMQEMPPLTVAMVERFVGG